MDFNETQKAAQAIGDIPPEKRTGQVRGTAVGIGAILLAIVILNWFTPPCPLWVFGLLLAFGAYSISGELVRGFAGFLPAVIRDVKAALKGNGNP